MTQPIPLHVLCAYLPYGVKMLIHGYETDLHPAHIGDPSGVILKLRPLSDLSKPLAELEGKTALKKIKEILSVRDGAWPKVYLDSEYKEGTPGIVIMPLGNTISIRCVPDYYMVPLDALEPVRELLLSLHFDLFGAIQKGWALDLNQEAK